MKESKIQKDMLQYLSSIGSYTFKTITSNIRGVPDIITCYKGRFFAFEVKTKIGKPTPLQQIAIDKILANGGIAGIVRSVEDVKELIAQHSQQQTTGVQNEKR